MPKGIYVRTEEHKRKIRETMLGRIITMEHRERISKSLIGKKKTQEHTNKMSNSLKQLYISGIFKNPYLGKKHNAEVRKKISDRAKGRVPHNKGKIWNQKIKNKISVTLKEKYKSGEIKSWNKGIPLSEEQKIKLRCSRAKQVLPLFDTTIEVKIQEYLKQLGISFFTHQYMTNIKHRYQCDIFIPILNMVIECDGDYWHHYPTGNEIDHTRTKELIEKGFKVLRLWESEIKVLTLDNFKEKISEMSDKK
ncbi:MAG: DUF559 domain-containing protein [Nanoarchaeota archaeon]